MKRILIIIFMSCLITMGFSATIQELGEDPYKLLAYSSELDEAQIRQVLEQLPFKRLFLIDFEGRKVCTLLYEDQTIACYHVKDFQVIDDVDSEKAVRVYLQIQSSLFEDADLTQPFSYNKLLLDDISYVDFLLKNLSSLTNSKYGDFKAKFEPSVVTDFLKHNNQMMNLFSNNMERYINKQETEINPTVYEEEKDKIFTKAYDFIIHETEDSHSQIEWLSFLLLYKDYQKEIYQKSGITFRASPWESYFMEKTLENACCFQISLNFLEYASKKINEDLKQLNLEFSKSYGVMNITSLTALLQKYTVFEIIALQILEHLKRSGTQKAKTEILGALINKKTDYQDVDAYLETIIRHLKGHISASAALLSAHENAYSLYKALSKTKKQQVTTVKDGLLKKTYQTIELIQSLEVKQQDVHFAVVDSTVSLSSDQEERFTKVYPVFPAETTKDNPIILLDFFHTAANHLTRTILRALKTIILTGFSIKQLEQEINAENVTVEITRYLKMEPFHELYRMKPTGNKRLKIKIENTNVGYLALDDLFAGNIPKVILNEIDKTPSTLEYNLARYPVEYYSPELTIPSAYKRGNKAIIFVHGKQNIPYFDDNSDFMPQIEAVWRNQGRMDVWNGFYDYVNAHPEDFVGYDFYEFTYDTSVFGAEGYGAVLSEILIENDIHTSYDEIHMIASSMGGLVSRYCLNHKYKLSDDQTPLYFGDYVQGLTTLDTPHLGTISQNFILTINPTLMEAVLKVKSDNPPNMDLTLGNFITSFVNGSEAEKSAELLIYFARNHPEMVGKLFTEMLRFLDPFPGGMCMLYTPKDYCESLGIYLYSETKNTAFEDLFVSDPLINQLNESDAYLDKLTLVSAELTEHSTDITQGLSITYELMRILGENLSHQTMDNLSRHGRNDGVVNLYSQQMWGIDKGQQRHHFMNLDHLAVSRNAYVVKFIMTNKILKSDE